MVPGRVVEWAVDRKSDLMVSAWAVTTSAPSHGFEPQIKGIE